MTMTDATTKSYFYGYVVVLVSRIDRNSGKLVLFVIVLAFIYDVFRSL